MIFSQQKVEEAKTKILAQELYTSPEGGFPKIYTFENKEKKVVFFAANHGAASKEEQFENIAATFNSLKPEVVLVEGMEKFTKDGPMKKDLEEKMRDTAKWEEVKKRNGENVFTYKLAVDNNLPIVSPEYTSEESISFFKERGYSDDEIFLSFCSTVAMIYTYQSHTDSIEHFLNKQVGGIYGADGSYYERFVPLAQQAFGDSVNLETGEGFKEKHNPNPPQPGSSRKWYFTNEMNKLLSRKRDEKILEEIAKQLELHDKIFIVYGGSHAVMLEPAIEYLIKEL